MAQRDRTNSTSEATAPPSSLPAAGGTGGAAPALPGATARPALPSPSTSVATNTGATAPVVAPVSVVEPGVARPATAPRLPRDELNTLAEDYGLDPTRYDTRAQVVAALADRKQLIASLDREAMLEVVRWGRRPVTQSATREQLALEIARVRRMNFNGLSRAGLVVLARMRGIACADDEPPELLIRKLRRSEGIFTKLNRARRSMIGSLAAKIVGEDDGDAEPYRYLAEDASANGGAAGSSAGASVKAATRPAPPPRLREQIEERGLFGGLADRVRRSADSYVNAKLDEIEARIDRKLDEIDKRLAEWRDKEIANRVRILKITLWASVIVSIISLIYAYVTRQVL